jgi:MFS family permease
LPGRIHSPDGSIACRLRPASFAPSPSRGDFASIGYGSFVSATHDPYAAFRFAPFRFYSISYFLAVIGSQMLTTAAMWKVHTLDGPKSLTESALKLALLSFVQALPILGLSIIAGQVVDRLNRKSVLIVTQVILVICPAVLALVAYAGALSAAWIYPVILLNSTALAFARPARQSLLPTLVPRAQFTSAVTWNSTLFETASVIGPALAGLIMSVGGGAMALVVSAASMFVCLVLTLFIPRPVMIQSTEPVTWKSVMAGFSFVYRKRLLWASMNLDMWAVLLGGATILLPIFAERLGANESGFGLLKSAIAIGAVSMALLQSHRPPMKWAGRNMLAAVALFGIGMIVFGLSTNYWLSFASLVFCGAMDNVSVIVRHSLVQLLTPDDMRGRVNSVNQVFIGASNELGNIEAALVAAMLGPVFSVVSGGVGTIVVVAYIAARYPEVRTLGKLSDVSPEHHTQGSTGI